MLAPMAVVTGKVRQMADAGLAAAAVGFATGLPSRPRKSAPHKAFDPLA